MSTGLDPVSVVAGLWTVLWPVLWIAGVVVGESVLVIAVLMAFAVLLRATVHRATVALLTRHAAERAVLPVLPVAPVADGSGRGAGASSPALRALPSDAETAALDDWAYRFAARTGLSPVPVHVPVPVPGGPVTVCDPAACDPTYSWAAARTATGVVYTRGPRLAFGPEGPPLRVVVSFAPPDRSPSATSATSATAPPLPARWIAATAATGSSDSAAAVARRAGRREAHAAAAYRAYLVARYF